MDKPLLVYTTFPDEALAAGIARTLVERRLAACVNLIPGMHSVYAWQGELEEGREVSALVKTRAGLREDVAAAIRALHPYETPVLLFIDAEADEATSRWISAETAALPEQGRAVVDR